MKILDELNKDIQKKKVDCMIEMARMWGTYTGTPEMMCVESFREIRKNLVKNNSRMCELVREWADEYFDSFTEITPEFLDDALSYPKIIDYLTNKAAALSEDKENFMDGIEDDNWLEEPEENRNY